MCDGTQGTPELRNKFIVGAGDEYAVGDNSATSNHQHDLTSDGHTHDITANPPMSGAPTLVAASTTASTQLTATTGNQDLIVKYYALAYIMKL